MYPHLSSSKRLEIPPLQFGESQVNSVCRDYYKDHSFCRNESGEINLWRLYNLFTGANKATYIDQFADRSVNAYEFAEQIKWGLDGKRENWYLN
jgi:hypothetical protein